jgi:hypothetical protein
MDQQQANNNLASTDVPRPQIMWDLTETQLLEIQTQFDEGDREGFNWRAESFGWTQQQAEEVWSWFDAGHRAVKQLKTASATS